MSMVVSTMEKSKTGERVGSIGGVGCKFKLSSQGMPAGEGNIWIKNWRRAENEANEHLGEMYYRQRK